ncbi:MAG: LamG domain-containing protein [Planctomycetes bacterium]|nr:LamG domain-containing protein [Planctomycetota bacterium]
MSARVFFLFFVALFSFRPIAADEIRTDDGLALRLSADGAVESVTGGSTTFRPVQQPKPIFRIREYRAKEWTDLIGQVDGAQLKVAAQALGLAVEAKVDAKPDRIEINGAVIDRRGKERSVEIMVALPAKATNTKWGLDIVEALDIGKAKARAKTPEAAPSAEPAAGGPYSLWIDAFDFDPEMGAVSVIQPDGGKRVLAVLARPGTQAEVDKKWRVFVVPGIKESDLAAGRLHVRIENFRGGPSTVEVAALYLMDAGKVKLSEAEANDLVAKSEEDAQKLSLASWIYAPAYRPKKGKRVWFFQRKSLRVRDASWCEFVLQRGERRMGDMAHLLTGHLPLVPNAHGILSSFNYPWATVTQKGAGGYTLAVSPEAPCRYRFQYDTTTDEVQLVIAYGLSVHPKDPNLKSRAPFRLVLYRTDDEWGFREAAARYHRLSPALFKRPTDRFGFWYGAGPYRDYRGLDGEYAYLEVHEGRLYPRHFLKDRAAWEEWKERLTDYFPRHADMGILVLPYRHFYHCSLHVRGDMDGTLPHMPKTYDEAMAMLRTLPIPFGNGYGHHLREVIDSSTMRRRDGRLDVKLSADDACAPTGRLIFRTSISPTLYDDKPDVMTNARMEMEFAKDLLKSFPQVGGIYYDAGAGGGGVTYSPDHLRYAHSPLAPGPGVARIAGKYEFGRWMGKFLHKHGKIDFVNGGAGMTCAQVWHELPFDCIGVEWPPVVGGERTLRFLRTVAGQKPVSFLKIQLAGDVESIYPTYVGKLGVYGVFPPPAVLRTGTRSRAATAAELAAPYAKLLQKMYLAGWQPVTHARCSDVRLLVERFGPADGRVYFAIFNPALSPIDAALTMDAKGLGLPRLTKAVAYFANMNDLSLTGAGKGRYRISVRVPALRLVVVEAGESQVDDPKQVTDFYPAKYRTWEAEASMPRLVGEWKFDDGAGQVARDTSGGNAHATLGRTPKVEETDPTWSAEGHMGGALLFDGKYDIVTLRDVSRLRIRNAFTIEAWIKRTHRTTHARVADFGGTCVYFEGDGDRVGLRIGGYSVNTAWSTPIPFDEWTHLKGTYDGKTISMYVNGALCEQKAFECASPIAGQGMTLGNTSTMSRPFAGLIDNVRIYNYVKK